MADINASFEEKIIHWSERFIGLPYGVGGPLGEGVNGLFDQDPLYRFDTFDCTTYIETVISLARAQNRYEFEETILQIRYKNAQPSYVTRNHISSLSWIPENIHAGFFLDVTNIYPSEFKQMSVANIDYPNWLRSHKPNSLKVPHASPEEKLLLLEKLKDLSQDFHPQDVEIEFLSIKDILGNWDEFDRVTENLLIANIVRPNWNLRDLIGTNLHISHQGFIIRKEGTLYFTHASTTGMVKQEALKQYLEKYKDSETVKGLLLLRPLP